MCLAVFFSCSSAPQPRPLDLTTVTGEIPISSISLIINRNVDNDGMGKNFLHSFFTENIDLIKEMLIGRGININDELFLNEIGRNSNIEFEEMRISPTFILHRYYWNSPSRHDTRVDFMLNFIIREDGTMPLEATVRRSDPNHEHGYATRVSLNLRFQRN